MATLHILFHKLMLAIFRLWDAAKLHLGKLLAASGHLCESAFGRILPFNHVT
jgi:hypothetical protein